jgi:hypothetical protein
MRIEGKHREETSPKCAIERYSRRGVNYYSLHFSLYLPTRKFVHNFGKKRNIYKTVICKTKKEMRR